MSRHTKAAVLFAMFTFMLMLEGARDANARSSLPDPINAGVAEKLYRLACGHSLANDESVHSPDGPNANVNQLMALARKLLGTPKNLQLIDGDTDVFGDGSVTLVSTPGHTPGHQSLLVHLRSSGFIVLSGDVVHLEENFKESIVPSLNTNKAQSIASMERVRQLIAAYKATFFINHDKSQTDKLRLLPAFYD
jgi:N-acyl homoserine lactone hydrolase